MASEITNKFSGQVMRVYFTVFSLDSLSLSLSTIKFSNDHSIQSPTCYISFNREQDIEETSKSRYSRHENATPRICFIDAMKP